MTPLKSGMMENCSSIFIYTGNLHIFSELSVHSPFISLFHGGQQFTADSWWFRFSNGFFRRNLLLFFFDGLDLSNRLLLPTPPKQKGQQNN